MNLSSVKNHSENEVDCTSKQKFNSSFRPIYIVSRIFGQMPFSIAYHSNGEIRRPVAKKFDAVWFVVSISVFIYYMFRLSKSFNMKKRFTTEILHVVDTFVSEIVLFHGFLAIILDMCNRFKLVDIFKMMIIFDKKANVQKFFFTLKKKKNVN